MRVDIYTSVYVYSSIYLYACWCVCVFYMYIYIYIYAHRESFGVCAFSYVEHACFRVLPRLSPLLRLPIALCAFVCCSVLQCVAVCCSVLRCVAVCCSVS